MKSTAERNYPRVPAKPVRERLLASIAVNEEGCWLWTKYVKPNGYAQILVPGRGLVYVHRASYEEFIGAIPDGMEVDHECHRRDSGCDGNACLHRRCLNPDHLSAKTPQQNTLRGTSPAANHATKTHCPKGHPYDEQNTYVRPDGKKLRDCKACRSEVSKAQNAERKGALLDVPVHAREARVKARVTHCVQGHEYTEDNTYIDTRGARQCRICRREAVRRQQEKRRAAKKAAG